jgi:hypothetical protein
MKRQYVLGLVACFLAAGSLPAQAIVLRYQPKVGEVTKHKASMAGRMETEMPGMDQTMHIEMTMSMDYSEKALSATDETTRLETRLLGGSATMKMNGESHTEDMPTGRMVADMDRRGRVARLVEADFGAPEFGEMMAPGGETFPNWSQFAAFPEGDVKVEDSWSDELQIPTGLGGPELKLTFTSRLLALTTFQDRRCAKIRSSFEGPMQFDMSDMNLPGEQGAEGSMEATLQGDMLWYYDYENSVYVYGEGSVGMDMKMSMAMPEGAGGTMTTRMVMNIKTTLGE